MQTRRHYLAAALLIMAVALLPTACFSATPQWSTATDRTSSSSSLGSTISLQVRWEGVTLRAVVARLTRVSETSIFVDRRLDPDALIDLAGQGTAAELMEQLAARENLEASSIGPVVYLGPRDAGREIRTLHARSLGSIAELPNDVRRKYLALNRCEWPRLAEPNQVLAQTIQSAGLELATTNPLPHDRWAAGKLPRMSLAERLTLLLVGFNRQWRASPQDGAVVVSPIERPVELIAWHEAPRRSQAKQSDFLRVAPHARVQVADRRWTLSGLVEEHTLLDNFLRGSPPANITKETTATDPPGDIATKRLTIALREQPFGAILAQLARPLDLEFTPTDYKPEILKRRVSLTVKEVSVEQLLTEIGVQADVTIRLEGKQIKIEAPSR